MTPIRAVCFDLFHTLVDVGRTPGTPGRYTADILGLDRDAWNGVGRVLHPRLAPLVEDHAGVSHLPAPLAVEGCLLRDDLHRRAPVPR